FLEPEEAARRPDRRAPVEALFVAVGQAGAVGGVAAEVEYDKRTDEAAGARGRHGPGDEHCSKNEYSTWMHSEPLLSLRSRRHSDDRRLPAADRDGAPVLREVLGGPPRQRLGRQRR